MNKALKSTTNYNRRCPVSNDELDKLVLGYLEQVLSCHSGHRAISEIHKYAAEKLRCFDLPLETIRLSLYRLRDKNEVRLEGAGRGSVWIANPEDPDQEEHLGL